MFSNTLWYGNNNLRTLKGYSIDISKLPSVLKKVDRELRLNRNLHTKKSRNYNPPVKQFEGIIEQSSQDYSKNKPNLDIRLFLRIDWTKKITLSIHFQWRSCHVRSRKIFQKFPPQILPSLHTIPLKTHPPHSFHQSPKSFTPEQQQQQWLQLPQFQWLCH